MSLLQPIIEQLDRQRKSPCTDRPADGSSTPASDHYLRSSTLGCHALWYVENLEQCSAPMLQYESAWINGRIDALERCLSKHGRNGEISRSEEELQIVGQMLEESQLFLSLLLREFAARGLDPAPPKAAVIPSEEAWEITSQKVKEEWGIV